MSRVIRILEFATQLKAVLFRQNNIQNNTVWPLFEHFLNGLISIDSFEVVTAVDGDEAVEKVFKERPNCIVLDVVLPKQNGFQLCRKLKNSDYTRHITIILLTSKNTSVDKSWGLRQGADMYMTKPFNTDELVANVRRLV